MDTDTTKSDWYLVIMIFLNGVRLFCQLHTLKKQLKNGTITKEKVETSCVVTTLLKLDRYVSEILERFKKNTETGG